MAGKAKTSFPISFNKTYELGVYYFPELPQPCCVTPVSIPESDATFDF